MTPSKVTPGAVEYEHKIFYAIDQLIQIAEYRRDLNWGRQNYVQGTYMQRFCAVKVDMGTEVNYKRYVMDRMTCNSVVIGFPEPGYLKGVTIPTTTLSRTALLEIWDMVKPDVIYVLQPELAFKMMLAHEFYATLEERGCPIVVLLGGGEA